MHQYYIEGGRVIHKVKIKQNLDEKVPSAASKTTNEEEAPPCLMEMDIGPTTYFKHTRSIA